MLCKFCNVKLSKDEQALCKKILGRTIKQFMCINCLADYLNTNPEDLYVKIEEFKENSCTLFN